MECGSGDTFSQEILTAAHTALSPVRVNCVTESILVRTTDVKSY